jgi:hypothetical protein
MLVGIAYTNRRIGDPYTSIALATIVRSLAYTPR